jgi:REP element-mobilizing transposase RayT
MYLLTPDDECRRIVKGCLARAADQHDVQLVCFCFLANHFHLIARFPKLNIAEFMEQFQSQLASRINDHRGRTGTVFPTRYHAQALLDETVLLDKIGYVLNNPVNDRQVAAADDWPGVTSMACHQTDANTLEGRWLNHKTWRRYRRRQSDDKGRDEAMETHRLELHLPEALDGETADQRRQSLLAAVKRELGFEGSPLGVDVWRSVPEEEAPAGWCGELLAADASEAEILDTIGERAVVVVSPIGGQGFVFGRGNDQISPAVLREASVEVVAAPSKLDDLGVLRVDLDDEAVAESLRGWTKVRTGRVERRMMKVV